MGTGDRSAKVLIDRALLTDLHEALQRLTERLDALTPDECLLRDDLSALLAQPRALLPALGRGLRRDESPASDPPSEPGMAARSPDMELRDETSLRLSDDAPSPVLTEAAVQEEPEDEIGRAHV